MGRKRCPPTDPRECINRAKNNLALARAHTTGARVQGFCFETPQVAKQAFKVVFVHRGVTSPFTHDLDRLLLHLERNGPKICW